MNFVSSLSRWRGCALLVFFALCFGWRSASAQLLCYEGFQYPVSKRAFALYPPTNRSPEGQPLKYFTEIDTHPVRQPYQLSIRVVDGSIPTQGSAFPFATRGNSLSWTEEWADVYASIDPNFQFDTLESNPPLYFSFAVRAEPSDNPVRQIAVAFSNGSSQRLQIGVDDSLNTGTPKFFACVANPQPEREYIDSKPFKYGETYFIAGKIETSATGLDVVQAAVFGPGDTVPERESDAVWMASAGAFTEFLVSTVAITVWGGDSGGVLVDELRIGSSWDAVATPPVKAAVEETAEAAPAELTAEETPPGPEKKGSPIAGILIAIGLLVIVGGGGVFYLLVLKPGAAPGASASKPPGPAKPAPPKPGGPSKPAPPKPTGPKPPPPKG